MSYGMTSSQKRHLLHQHIVHLHAIKSKKLKKMAIKGSSSEEEEEDASKRSSSDENESMNSDLYKQVKNMNKWLKKINLKGYMVFLKDGHHSSTYEGERIKFKKRQEKNEKKPKHEAYATFGERISGAEESSANSNDESNKRFTTRTNMCSSSNTCLMATGMESDVSDDSSDAPSIDELFDLVHEHQKIIKKQSKEIKNLNDLNASLATNYEDLLCKFKLLNEKHEELKLKIESINELMTFGNEAIYTLCNHNL